MLGAEARYGIDRLIPPPATGFPWATLLINVSGCLLIGVLMVLLVEVWSPHRYARPFLGVGVLGGYTTFSTFAVDAVRLVRAQHAGSRRRLRARQRRVLPACGGCRDHGHPAGRQGPRRRGGSVIALFVALGAGWVPRARYLTDRAVQSAHDTVFPWGTMTVNVVASLALGILTGAAGHVSAEWSALIGTGFCGALSTFSTFSYETMRLAEERERFHAIANVVVSLLAGLGAAALGWALGNSIG